MNGVKPERVFYYFEEICKIPHGSYNIQKISDYIAGFANDKGLNFVQDELGNVIIYKDASAGYETHPTVIIQGHMDMVAVKTPECTKDMETEGLDLEWNDEYLWAKGTSLGADDGVAVAMALAILEDDAIKHPPIEAVFTVNEEVGMDGAIGLDMSLLKGRLMLNVDSEEEGILTVGCAGGQTVKASLSLKKESAEGTKVSLTIKGLLGGHSGTMIKLQRANANVLMGRLLAELDSIFDIRIINVAGGEKGNAICLECNSEVVILDFDKAKFSDVIEKMESIFKAEYMDADPGIKIVSQGAGTGSYDAMDESCTKSCYGILISEPNGVIDYNSSINGLVETSLNIGIVKTKDDVFFTQYELRSSVGSKISFLANRVYTIATALGAQVSLGDAYPEWEYNRNSKLIGVMSSLYEKQYGKKMEIEIIHAGLECGVFSKALDGLDAVSFGPNIPDIHTTNEKLDIKSTERVYNYILKVLEEI